MKIRALEQFDFMQIKDLHERFYKDEFELPDFLDKYLCAFVVENDATDKLICAGGVRTIAESVIMTNKQFSVRERYEALYEVLEASMYITGTSGYTQLHAFVQDQRWQDQLIKVGFRPTKGTSIVLDI